MVTHYELVRKILKHQGIDPNLWRVQRTMRVPSFYEEYQMFNFTLCSMNNDDEMGYLWTINPNISKGRIHSSQWFSNTTQFRAFLDMGSREQIDDLIESGTIRLLDWNNAMTNIQLAMRFVDKIQAISAVQKWPIRTGREYRVVKRKSNQWMAKIYHHSD
ncbi:hypothetical protein M9H77_26967 [Catharanthus roseus]|uniref:Uncharacterized protein n=1 Tax=Catharanthus roseus TaxID=4058 RepID=A0ACC0AC20_CATRO|nr:hypothetical protein M9H77_26967 [Catharanthus roseus]